MKLSTGDTLHYSECWLPNSPYYEKKPTNWRAFLFLSANFGKQADQKLTFKPKFALVERHTS